MSDANDLLPPADTPLEELGRVTAPSGAVLLLDAGLLNLWKHDRPPVVEEGEVADESLRRKMNESVDLAIEGPDAEAAGRAFDRQWHPRFLFDMPEDFGQVRAAFDALVRERNLIARLVPLPERVTHRRRVDLALAHGRGAGEVPFTGGLACAAAGAPSDRPLRVLGQRMPPGGPDASRWRHVFLECRPDLAAVASAEIGYVVVDEARLMFADADALAHWRHEESLDGLADYLFWGADAAELAADVGAAAVDDGGGPAFGWTDLPLAEAVERGTRVQRLRDERGLKAAADFRPHSHHNVAMRAARTSPTESGTVDVAGATMCLFMTTWGDGMFRIYRDVAADGTLVRVRADLGNEQIVDRQRRFEEWWFGAFAKMAVVTNRVAAEGLAVNYLYRDPTDRENDSGWCVFHGDEDDAYLDDARNSTLLPLRELIRKDKALEDVFRAPAGTAFERDDVTGAFSQVEAHRPRE